jgi:probable F420-dependent oxidoreductase
MEFGVYGMNMHHGMGLDAFLGRPFPPGLAISRETMAAVADLAEESGLSSVWFGDHIILPTFTAHTQGHGDNQTPRFEEPVFDQLAVLGWLGGRTRRLTLATNVLVVPFRNPVVTAKFFSSLDTLIGGRLIIGIGVGGVMVEEFEALGAPFKDRGAVTDDYLRVMRELWTSDEPSYDGEHYHLAPGLRFLPKPVKGNIPIWVGGNSKFALRRTARLGDGWLGVYLTHDDIRTKWDQLQELIAAEGRDPASITLANQTRFFINDEPYPDAPMGVGSVDKVVDDIARMGELGVEHLLMSMPPGPTTESILEQIHRFVDDVRPQLPAHLLTSS